MKHFFTDHEKLRCLGHCFVSITEASRGLKGLPLLVPVIRTAHLNEPT